MGRCHLRESQMVTKVGWYEEGIQIPDTKKRGSNTTMQIEGTVWPAFNVD